jgi:hypothetical protein
VKGEIALSCSPKTESAKKMSPKNAVTDEGFKAQTDAQPQSRVAKYRLSLLPKIIKIEKSINHELKIHHFSWGE